MHDWSRLVWLPAQRLHAVRRNRLKAAVRCTAPSNSALLQLKGLGCGKFLTSPGQTRLRLMGPLRAQRALHYPSPGRGKLYGQTPCGTPLKQEAQPKVDHASVPVVPLLPNRMVSMRATSNAVTTLPTCPASMRLHTPALTAGTAQPKTHRCARHGSATSASPCCMLRLCALGHKSCTVPPLPLPDPTPIARPYNSTRPDNNVFGRLPSVQYQATPMLSLTHRAARYTTQRDAAPTHTTRPGRCMAQCCTAHQAAPLTAAVAVPAASRHMTAIVYPLPVHSVAHPHHLNPLPALFHPRQVTARWQALQQKQPAGHCCH